MPQLTSPSRFNILVVEDNPMLAELTLRILRRMGLEPRHAKCGDLAIQALNQSCPDLMLLDVNLPDMEGWRVLEYARAKYGDRPRVIVATAYDDTLHRLEGRVNAIDNYLVKPVSKDTLTRAVEDALTAIVTAERAEALH
ncbi:MAG: response regulator [bacterium]|nr:response regulator [bacterium]